MPSSPGFCPVHKFKVCDPALFGQNAEGFLTFLCIHPIVDIAARYPDKFIPCIAEPCDSSIVGVCDYPVRNAG